MSQLFVDNIKNRTGGALGLPGGVIVTGVGTVTGDLNISGTLSYEDVVNVDSVGIITAQSGIRVGAGQSIGSDSGTVYYYGNGENLTGVASTDNIITGTAATFNNLVKVGSNIKLDAASGIITATDFDSLSDVNLKENIITVDNALELTNQLRGVRFEWKDSGSPSYGVIAQELEQVLPELVSQGDPKSVNYSGIIGVLIESIKELKAEIEELKNR